MKGRNSIKSIANSICTGIFAVFLFLLFYFAANRNTAPFMLIIRETFPLYGDGASSVVNLYTFGALDTDDTGGADDDADFADAVLNTIPETIPGDLDTTEPPPTEQSPQEQPEEEATEVIGISNVIYQPGTDITINDNSQTELITKTNLSGNIDNIISKLYTIDKRTSLLASDIDVEAFINANHKIDMNSNGPKVLIFHTHSQEAYSDSTPGDIADGIFAVGDRLQQLLETKYGIETLHDKTSYDIVDGKSHTLGAYERMEPSINDILNKHPSIELVLDMHRDGVADNVRFVTDINGKPTAKFMFFNGLSRVYQNGALTEIAGLPNSYVKDNLALSFNLQLMANELFPNLTRKIYINAYRYSLHFKPKSLLVEVGAQTNTKAEALNAMEPLAEILAKTIK